MAVFNRKTVSAGVIAAALIATPVVKHFEGRSLVTYIDPVGIPTYCDGETVGAVLGQKYTDKQCDELTQKRLIEFAEGVDKAVNVHMPDARHAALTSFAYNVGLENFRRSTLLKKLNAGDTLGACNELRKWVYAKGIKWRGLVRRREAERKLCLAGEYPNAQ